VLPVSGLSLRVREATGADEMVVLEPTRPPVATVLTLAGRLLTDQGGGTPAWDELPAADVGAIALTIRQAWLGELISTDTRCPNPGCLERMDIAFEIPAYLAHHRRRTYRGVRPGRDAGWFELGDTPVSFRLPTIGDLRAVTTPVGAEQAVHPEEAVHPEQAVHPEEAVHPEHAERSLTARCVRPATVTAAVARRVSRAMTALAPPVGGTVTVRCPACGGTAQPWFDPVSYALAELRDAAAGLYEEVHLLASAFHWPEEAILALPRSRRAKYAVLIRRDRAAA
jgi:hypothetical protein